ncbi:nuclear factor related to kappa-B-binding protein [Anthonomus grandis grandis]|uniref:nuclear factor related to kappa-B-binding protein n=1 Tax=Anthonomus grandis grandis TaxID=2921223 RepID=UPI0021660BBC|nr:nuclear factor related to kappa-B-binding protein [Anthonomus grandis grandis]
MPKLHFSFLGIKLKDIISRTQLPFIRNLQQRPSHVEPKPIFRKRIKKEIPEPRKSTETPVLMGKLNSGLMGMPSSNSESDCDSIIDAVTVPNSGTSEQIGVQLSPTPSVQIKQEIKSEPIEIKEEIIEVVQTVQHPPTPVMTETVHPVNNMITSNYGEITPIKIEDLETIDIMNTPIELDNSEIDIMELSIKPELMQETHANFFSLVRDVICSTNEHRMNMYTLQERLKAWQENPISPLNDWYSYVDNWINILPSAITFLCGNASEQPDDFVPYMEYKMNLDVYQWIGAGRDSDQLLNNLCTFWLQHRTESKMTKPMDIEIDISDRDSTPPPPRCPTTWTVRKSTSEEIRDYQEQERRRYDNPHKAFTFRCNGYESVVGPLRGIYYPATANAKARGHTMLNADRPNFVTILSLVRDATARLPNGEGTRSDICELLKSSQYISSTAPDNILQSVVSGALDRMHTQWDPCVKYDQKRKIWIYLHRHRTEDDFERIHQHYQGIQKVRKPPRKSPAKPKLPKSEKPVKTTKGQNQKAAASSNVTASNSVSSKASSPVNSPVVTQKMLPPAEIKQENVLIKQEPIMAGEDSKEEVMVDVNGVQEPLEAIQPKIPEQHEQRQPIAKPSSDVITVTVPQKVVNKRRQSNFQGKKAGNVPEKLDDKILLVQTSSPNLISATQKGTSLLISNNPPRQQQQQHQQQQHSQQEVILICLRY